MYIKVLEYLCKTMNYNVISGSSQWNIFCEKRVLEISSKILVIELIFCKLEGFYSTILLNLNSFRTPYLQKSSLWVIIGRGFLTVPILWRSPYIAYPNFCKFCPTPFPRGLQPIPPLLFLMSSFLIKWVIVPHLMCYFS